VWETLEGWAQPLDDCSSVADLPPAARAYVEFVERELEVPIELVGVGASRDRVLA
jgi:adenylosuccinate synthase